MGGSCIEVVRRDVTFSRPTVLFFFSSVHFTIQNTNMAKITLVPSLGKRRREKKEGKNVGEMET